VEVENESVRLGGAANVAHNIRALGGEPLLVGLIGDDHPGKQFLAMLAELNSRPTESSPTRTARPRSRPG